MKCSLECEVVGKVKIRNRIQIKEGDIEFILIPDEKGLLSSIKIITEVIDPSKFSSRIVDGKADLNIVIDGDIELRKELIKEFQILESLLSFDTEGSLRRIKWDEPKEDFIPENEEEEKRIQVRDMHFIKEYPEVEYELNEDIFTEVVSTRNYFDSIIITLSFYREGINEFHSRRYINAFYNFYFILEDLYGQGKTKNRAIGEAFKESKEFRGFIKWMIEGQLNAKHMTNIQKLCTEEKVSFDVDGLIDLLLKIRGNLHHYSGKSSKHIGTPFIQEDFESAALFVLGLSVRAVLARMVEINQARGMKPQSKI